MKMTFDENQKCRFCQSDARKLFDINDETKSLYECCMRTNLPDLPGSKVCIRCYYLLEEFKGFKLMCMESEFRLFNPDFKDKQKSTEVEDYMTVGVKGAALEHPLPVTIKAEEVMLPISQDLKMTEEDIDMDGETGDFREDPDDDPFEPYEVNRELSYEPYFCNIIPKICQWNPLLVACQRIYQRDKKFGAGHLSKIGHIVIGFLLKDNTNASLSPIILAKVEKQLAEYYGAPQGTFYGKSKHGSAARGCMSDAYRSTKTLLVKAGMRQRERQPAATKGKSTETLEDSQQ